MLVVEQEAFEPEPRSSLWRRIYDRTIDLAVTTAPDVAKARPREPGCGTCSKERKRIEARRARRGR